MPRLRFMQTYGDFNVYKNVHKITYIYRHEIYKITYNHIKATYFRQSVALPGTSPGWLLCYLGKQGYAGDGVRHNRAIVTGQP
jgi:hypothetical protein